MTARMALANIVSFGLQVGVLVAAGAVLARVFRIDEPRAMLAYWRTLLFACLLLPFAQPWSIVVPPALTAATQGEASEEAFEPNAQRPTPGARRSPVRPIGDLVLIVLAAGIAVRAVWLTIGAYGLRRLRRDASPLDPLPESVGRAQERVGARAEMYVSDRVSGPITFGLLRPVVLFPPGVSGMPEHVQEAIACHELLHVQRRDWPNEILEEIVRTVLWFHPGIWWLIGRIRLTREQVVDQAAIQLIDSRERYVEALLAVAVSSSPARFVPASPFLRRHLLKKRVARILQETTMSTRRLIASFTVSAAALALAATFAVRSFPLEAQAQAPVDTKEPIQLVRGGEHLLHGGLPEYPHRAINRNVEGDVVVEMTLDDRGEVSDARVMSGPEELRRATLEAVLQWHYSPAAMSSTSTQATLRFRVPPEGFEKTKGYATGGHYEVVVEDAHLKAGNVVAGNVSIEKLPKKVEIEKAADKHDELVTYSVALKEDSKLADKAVFWKLIEDRSKPKFDGTSKLIDLRTERVPEATAREVLAQAGVNLGDVMTEETAKRIRQAAETMDEHFTVAFWHDKKAGGVVVTIGTAH